MADRLRMVIAEDNYLVREGTRRLLEDSGEVQVLAGVGNGDELLTAVRQLRPDDRYPGGAHRVGVPLARTAQKSLRSVIVADPGSRARSRSVLEQSLSPVRSRRAERYLLSPWLTFWRMRGCRVRCMPTFVLRLIAPRPNFAQTMTDAEREIMNRHAATGARTSNVATWSCSDRSSLTTTRTASRLSRPMTSRHCATSPRRTRS